MAQINLLKQNTTGAVTQKIPSLIAKLLGVVFIAAIGYYAWLFFEMRSVERQSKDIEQQISKEKGSIVEVKQRDELLTRQLQLKELGSLMQAHTYWSSLLPELAKVTLKTASYTSIHAANDGELSLVVNVPGVAELDKFLQVFDRSEFNENFSDVSIGSISKTQDQGSLYTTFEVRMKFNPALLRYSEQGRLQGSANPKAQPQPIR